MNSKSQGLAARFAQAVVTGLATVTATVGLSTACLNRDIGEPPPRTTNVFVEKITQSGVDKIDLLFMVDNSISMADKQLILQQAVPELLRRLITPKCEAEDGSLTDMIPAADGSMTCPEGMKQEFTPIEDIHIGVLSSSVGAPGDKSIKGTALVCAPTYAEFNQTHNDQGQLIAPPISPKHRHLPTNPDFLPKGTRTEVPLAGGLPFLAWDPQAKYGPGNGYARADQETMITTFKELVGVVGEMGCGYEAVLEGWYRFLIDPQPYQDLVTNGQNVESVGIDTDVLAQRAEFLRPDSLVAIVMLTDENDCSIRGDGVAWLVANASDPQLRKMPRATEICQTSPNDKCCRSCMDKAAVEGCGAVESDPECQKEVFTNEEDHLNNRCFNQKQRFGIDFLYETDRYVNALLPGPVYGRKCGSDADCGSNHETQKPGTCDATYGYCAYDNPLFSDNPRHKDATGQPLVPRQDSTLVFVAGIVGVPWQDIATPASLDNPSDLVYQTSAELSAAGLWDVIVGDPYPEEGNPVLPKDPFMIESVARRDQAGLSNPVTSIAPTPPGTANVINGWDYTINGGNDLQYACIFDLPEGQRECDPQLPGGVAADKGCDCRPVTGSAAVTDRPLCVGTVQSKAKAYPGLRVLDVLRKYGANSIVASVCPKIVDANQGTSPAYGYNPAVAAIINRLKEALKGTCLPRRLEVDEEGNVPCKVVEATNPRYGIQCNTRGREDINDKGLREAVLGALKKSGRCDGQTDTPCKSVQLCSLTPAQGNDLTQCRNNDPAVGVGYCYIDATLDPPLGNPKLVEDCQESQKRILRFISPSDQPVPAKTSTIFVACQGAPIQE